MSLFRFAFNARYASMPDGSTIEINSDMVRLIVSITLGVDGKDILITGLYGFLMFMQ